MIQTNSKRAFQEACNVLPGGVDSPVRSFSSVNGTPIFIDHADGSHIYDIDGNDFIDYIGSWGPMILGHNHPDILQTVIEECKKGLSYGLPNEKETALAQLMIEAYPHMEMVRFVTSGTEAAMSAIRLARGFTHKDKVIKFSGCYHGHSDGLLVKSGSGTVTYGTSNSKGVPPSAIQDTLVCAYNDIDSVKEAIDAFPNQIAAIILESVAANMGVIPASQSFLQELRRLCDEHQIVLIFDEVITGFRLAYGGAAQYYGITPDLACFGKIIGAGMSVGAYGGRKEIMQMVSPLGEVYQAGTLAGNPLAMACGIAQLSYLKNHQEIYEQIDVYAQKLQAAMQKTLKEYNLPWQVNRVGSLLTLFFTKHSLPLQNFNDVQTCDPILYGKFQQMMMEEGILLAPSQFEAMFISAAHTSDDLEKTIHAFQNVIKELS